MYATSPWGRMLSIREIVLVWASVDGLERATGRQRRRSHSVVLVWTGERGSCGPGRAREKSEDERREHGNVAAGARRGSVVRDDRLDRIRSAMTASIFRLSRRAGGWAEGARAGPRSPVGYAPLCAVARAQRRGRGEGSEGGQGQSCVGTRAQWDAIVDKRRAGAWRGLTGAWAAGGVRGEDAGGVSFVLLGVIGSPRPGWACSCLLGRCHLLPIVVILALSVSLIHLPRDPLSSPSLLLPRPSFSSTIVHDPATPPWIPTSSPSTTTMTKTSSRRSMPCIRHQRTTTTSCITKCKAIRV